ncbi:hypothetical protein AAIP55_002218 [Flavobacterium psychrophilum]|nr:hypothetical protein [Flavobacterium psychrophilum]
MTAKQLIPDYRNYCQRFIGDNNEVLTIKIPYIQNYYSAGSLLSNLVKGIGILAQYSIENENDEVVSIISDLAEIATSLNFDEELQFVDSIINFSQQEELTQDEKTKVLKDEIEMLKGSNRYLSNELRNLKIAQNEKNI